MFLSGTLDRWPKESCHVDKSISDSIWETWFSAFDGLWALSLSLYLARLSRVERHIK
jgi:hypothetical protein